VGSVAAGLSGHHGCSERSLGCHCDWGRHPGLLHCIPPGQTQEEGPPAGAGTVSLLPDPPLRTVLLSSPREAFPELAGYGAEVKCSELSQILQFVALLLDVFHDNSSKFHSPSNSCRVSRCISFTASQFLPFTKKYLRPYSFHFCYPVFSVPNWLIQSRKIISSALGNCK
jgi:hypothetical protein